MMANKRLGAGFWITLGALAFVGGLCLWGVVLSFRMGGAPISTHGWIAMALAIVFAGGGGGGLMWLAFQSSKRGVDDKANRFR